MNRKTISSVHGYAGDQHQVEELMPMYEHHGLPIVLVSPDDSQFGPIGPHHRVTAGKRAYIGQESWDRQVFQMEALLQYPFDFILMNDSDSFVLTKELPEYLYQEKDVVWSNQVDDFRKPGQTWDGVTWPTTYHQGRDLIAMQPPYFLSRSSVQAIVKSMRGVEACPITPFIDWFFVEACYRAGLRHKGFQTGASCETSTVNGLAVMSQCIRERGATFIHSVKSGAVLNQLLEVYRNK